MTNHPNRSKPCFYKNPKDMKRCEQLADAFYRIARADHYMVGIADKQVTREECDDAEQILIPLEYTDYPRNVRRIARFALDLLQHYRSSLPV